MLGAVSGSREERGSSPTNFARIRVRVNDFRNAPRFVPDELVV